MAGFLSQPDEGYSEDPLNPSSAVIPVSPKPRDDAIASTTGPNRRGAEFPEWLIPHIANLSVNHRTGKPRSIPYVIRQLHRREISQTIALSLVCRMGPDG